jgi:hypothetical protein
MGISKQIGWGTESNILYEILKELKRLKSTIFGIKPKYKVYTALLTQSGTSNLVYLFEPTELIVGATYTISFGTPGGDIGDFTNVGAPNNEIGTQFVATGTTPAVWGGDGVLIYDTGAPVVTVLENTIGNIWFIYDNVGTYFVKSNGLFVDNKTVVFIGPLDLNIGPPIVSTDHFVNDSSTYLIVTNDPNAASQDEMLFNTPIEIRVYN